jgi:hypothetical protein
MKWIIFINLFLSFSAYAEEICEPNPVSQITRELELLSLPNCYNSRLSGFREKRDEAVCLGCQEKFWESSKRLSNLYRDLYGEWILPPSKEAIQENLEKNKKDFLKISVEEYKKSLTESLLTAIKMRALPLEESSFPKAIEACSFKTSEAFKGSDPLKKSCPNQGSLHLLDQHLTNLKKELSNEVAKILSTDPNFKPKPTLLIRENPPGCFIPEIELIRVASETVEEEFSPELMEFFGSIDPKKFHSAAKVFDDPQIKTLLHPSDPSEFFDSIKQHPILAQKFSSPKSIKEFFSQIPKPYTREGFRKALLSKKEGEKIDQELAKNCNDSFEALKNVVCSNEFNAGNLRLDPVTNFQKITSNEFISDSRELVTDVDLIKKNRTLFNHCGNYQDQQALSLNQEAEKIAAGVEAQNIERPYFQYSSFKYDQELGNLNQILCSATCKPGSIDCKFLAKFQNKSQLKLAHASHADVNRLLKTLIGDAKDIPPETLVILREKGILPQANGSLAPQPDVPLNRFSSQNQLASAGAAPALRPAPSSERAANPSRSVASSSDRSAESFIQAPPLASASDSSAPPSFEEDQESRLGNIENEIRRRLENLPSGVPRDRSEAREIVRANSRQTQRTLSSQEENKIIDRMMNPSSQAPGVASFSAPTEAAVSDAPTQAKKDKLDQMNRALAQMAGARATEAAPEAQGPAPLQGASPTSSDLAIVPLNLTLAPELDLSKLLSEKFHQRDSETQMIQRLLKSNRNFVLKLQNMNFKVMFDGPRLNLLLESGDRDMAAMVRPKLEVFLGRLRSS